MRVRYRIVDVFTDRPLAGNALCVVLDPVPLPVMQALAREVNLSETSFPVVTGERTYETQFFTPEVELPFAGHPTLGTAWVLGPGRWTQTTPGATVAVEADADGAVMEQPVPVFTEVHPAAAVAALGLPPAAAPRAWVAEAGGARHLVVPADAPIERLRPDMVATAAASRAVRAGSVAVFRRVDDATLHLRVFLPASGIDEDPGTGSVAGPVALLARRLLGTADSVVVTQGDEIGRPSRMTVELRSDVPHVGGRVAACAEGVFTLG